MNEVKKERITQLAIDAHRKGLVYKALVKIKVPEDPDEAEKHAVAFAIAMADGVEAEHLLKVEISGQGTFADPQSLGN